MKRYISLILVAAIIIGIPVVSFAITPFFQDPDAIQKAAESVLMLTCYDKDGNAISTGSGFLAFEDGIIVTNYHVIEGDVFFIKANTEDGIYFDVGKVVCYDQAADIAILRTNARTRLSLLILGDSDKLTKASKVITIGSPLGLLNTVSEGLYSGFIDNGAEYILFTAAISHGSSGGALFNEDGEVIGITSASFTEGQNLNLAVPINSVKQLWDDYSTGLVTENINLTIEEFYNLFDHTREYSLAELMLDPEAHQRETLIVCGYRGEGNDTSFVLYELYDDYIKIKNYEKSKPSISKWDKWVEWDSNRPKPIGKTIEITNWGSEDWNRTKEGNQIVILGKFVILGPNNYTINASQIDKVR